MTALGVSGGPRRRETRSYSSLILAAFEGAAIGTAAPAAAWARSAAAEIASGWWARGLARAAVEPLNRRTRCLTPMVLATVGRRLARQGEYLAAIEVRGGAVALEEAWQWDVYGGPARASWLYRLTETGPTETRHRVLPAAGVAHIRYAYREDQPWRGASPAAFAGAGAGLVGGIDHQMSTEAGSPSGYVMPTPNQQRGEDEDEDDPRLKLRRDLHALNGGLTLAATMADGYDSGRDAAPRHDYRAERFGFDPPENVIPLRRQSVVDMLGCFGIGAPLLDERASAAAYREALRTFTGSALPALGALIAEQLGEALGVEGLRFEFPQSTDLVSRSRAFRSLVGQQDGQPGLSVEDARAVVGL